MPPELPKLSELPEPEKGSEEGEKDSLATFENVEDQISDIAQGGRFGHRIDQDIAFPSEILDIICQNRIDQTVSRQYNKILDKINKMERNQYSGWIYEYEKKIFLEISMYQLLQDSFYFALPKIWSKPQLEIINPQNTDERCFETCMKAYLTSEEACRQSQRARNLHNVSRLQCFNNILDFSGINFLFTLRDIDIFEENNPNYAVNMFYPVPEKNNKEQATRKLDPLRLSKYNYQKEYMVNLILFTKGEEDLRDCCNINEISPGLNTHYCLINGENGWNRIIRNWNKHHGYKYFCHHCMIALFSRKDLLEEHIKSL
ncbi:1659_t:CDS:2 [Dentiscutata heterogama]|uniref:1659_t:CDS:1 n=1 Tax=Dentiscutata heterogama TaxID=1316150 RepID=A0ACA9LKR0_9GLOM|nr:1659_t:CDS:2 [Dentiscutata heterogama]